MTNILGLGYKKVTICIGDRHVIDKNQEIVRYHLIDYRLYLTIFHTHTLMEHHIRSNFGYNLPEDTPTWSLSQGSTFDLSISRRPSPAPEPQRRVFKCGG